LESPIFRRVYEQFETFNRLYERSLEDKEDILSRFQQLFSGCPKLVDYVKNSREINKEEFVNLLLSNPNEVEVLKQLLAGAEDERDGRAGIFTYELDKSVDNQNDRMILHIPPYDGDNFKEELTESLAVLADKLKEKPEIKKVAGYSWLFENKWIKRLIPEGFAVEDGAEPEENEQQEDLTGSQRAALMFSKRTLRQYLKKGELPTSSGVSMSRDEFIKHFSR